MVMINDLDFEARTTLTGITEKCTKHEILHKYCTEMHYDCDVSCPPKAKFLGLFFLIVKFM